MKIALAAAAVLVLAWPALADSPNYTVAVSGSATATLAPDYATITLGVVSQATGVSDALAENSTKMNRVVDALKALGIPDNCIQTASFSIQPRYQKLPQGEDYDSDDMRPIAGYAVRNNVTVTVTDLKKVAKVIDETVRAGANASSTVTFSVRDPSRYLDKVRAAAVDAAHHKAEILTAAAHMKLGRALSITDGRANLFNRGGSEDIQSVPIAVSAFSGADIPTPILYGEINITADVTVYYDTK